jgi:LAO/AO transport system kinase
MPDDDLIAALLSGNHRALARVITRIENRKPGYRELVAQLHEHTGTADIIGITGSPGAGKSTLVDKMAATYRDRGETVGVIAIDPSSPFTGGAVLGDRIRMASTVGDMEVFVRSMSARGSLGGLSTATTDAVKALDAFGKDKIIIETVGAGQNEIEIVKTADTVAVLVPPSAGDDIQMLKAGILEIADIFVVNKADKEGADRTVMELRETIEMRDSPPLAGHGGLETTSRDAVTDESEWEPVIVKTVATTGDGIEEFLETVGNHVAWLTESGELEAQARRRYEAEIKTLLREDAASLLETEIAARGGIESHVDRVLDHETDPYSVADELLGPIEECVTDSRDSTR